MRVLAAAAALALALTACGTQAPSSAPATPSTAAPEIASASSPLTARPGRGSLEPESPGPSPLPPEEAGGCGRQRASAFIGRQVSPAVRAEVTSAVGRRATRWIGPGDVVTMDYSESRLNMMLDAGGRIVAVKCG